MSAPENPTRQRYKVLVLGPPAAGKTALVRRLAEGSFVEGARQRGLDFYTCHITLRDDFTVALQLWDLSDCPCRPDDDHASLSAYVFNSQAVLLVYDVSYPSSLESLRYALRAVEAAIAAAGSARPYLALVANKCDLHWTASEPLARELAARHGCMRYALSARSGQGVDRIAVQLACDLAGVPLAATAEHSARFLEPDGASLSPYFADHPEQEIGPAPAPAAAATSHPYAAAPPPPSGPAANATAAALQRHMSAGKFHALAPPYQTNSQTPPQAPSLGSFEEPAMGSMGSGSGEGGSGQPWRPISRSMTPTRTTTLISKTGPFGQRIRSCSPPPPVPPPPPVVDDAVLSELKKGVGSLVKHEALAREKAQAQGVLESCGSPLGRPRQRPRRGWRVLLCCIALRR